MSKKKSKSGATSNPAWYGKGRSGNPGCYSACNFGSDAILVQAHYGAPISLA